ncbi:MAG: universal stress protein [Desulfobacterales bacterium]|jgi:nucleotide-binding universal stress UspA family protein
MKQAQPVCPLTKCKRILVAMDRSKYSEKAFDQAISIAKICKSTLFIVSVIDLYHEVKEIVLIHEDLILKGTTEFLEEVKAKATKENIPCETIVHVGGQPHEFIIQEAKEKNIDLIVMGTHGRTGLEKLLIGSVAERVVGHAPCAVMVTPV